MTSSAGPAVLNTTVRMELLDSHKHVEWDAFIRSSKAPRIYNETGFFIAISTRCNPCTRYSSSRRAR